MPQNSFFITLYLHNLNIWKNLFSKHLKLLKPLASNQEQILAMLVFPEEDNFIFYEKLCVVKIIGRYYLVFH